jgi:general nucleoside transport system permease protein
MDIQKSVTGHPVSEGQQRFSETAERVKNILLPAIAIVISLTISAIVVQLSGRSASLTMHALYEGSFGSPSAIGRTLLNATPLVLTGLSVAFSFRAGMFNVGGEGQFYLGALTAAWLGVALPFSGIAAILIVMVFSALVGAFWGAIPGYLKAVTSANEIVTTIMLNFVAIYFNSFITLKVLSGGSGFPGTAPVPSESRIARMFEWIDMHWGFFVALLVAFAAYILLWRTSWGYELRVTGLSQSTAQYVGFSIKRNIVIAMAISGAMAGLAGAIEVLAVYGKMIVPFVSGVGFSGIAVALVGQVHPLGCVLAAFMLGALSAGGQRIQFVADVPNDLVQLVIGLILLTVTASRIPPVVKKYAAHFQTSLSDRLKPVEKP